MLVAILVQHVDSKCLVQLREMRFITTLPVIAVLVPYSGADLIALYSITAVELCCPDGRAVRHLLVA